MIKTNLNPIMTDLTSEEKDRMMPYLIKYLKKLTELKPQTEKQIVSGMEYLRIRDGRWKSKMSGARLRKMINWLRGNEIIGIIGDSSGYWTTEDYDTLMEQADRGEQRMQSMMFQIQGTRNYAKRIQMEKREGKTDVFGIKWD